MAVHSQIGIESIDFMYQPAKINGFSILRPEKEMDSRPAQVFKEHPGTAAWARAEAETQIPRLTINVLPAGRCRGKDVRHRGE
jgi:hypothetical protein